MPNRTVNDIFSQTGKLAIVTGLIGELGHKPALALAAAEALQMKLFSRSSVAPRTSRINNRFRGSWRWILYAMKSVYW